MSDAPERIWAFYAPHIAEDENGATIVAYETVQHGAAEYVRANMQPTVSPELLATTNDMAALLDAAEKVINSYWHSTDGVITGIYDLEAALARVKGETK